MRILEGKTVLVTGGTGSFGHAIVPELLKYDVRELTIFSRDEEKQLDMRRDFDDRRLKFVIGDIRDLDRLRQCVHADFVYHAAALKIIPTCEVSPLESIKTNLQGTINVKKACQENGVERAVFISTDKAVKPVNAYGMSKALAERVWLDPEPSNTLFAVVRYGNVVGSRGSVVPVFKKLVELKKPIPITSKDMTRFLITLKQAINLVLTTTENMRGGEVFIPKIPACTITQLIEALAGKDYPVVDVGIRQGEKIAETLISEEEMRRTEEKDTLFVIHPYGRYESNRVREEYTSETTRRIGVEDVRMLLKEAAEL